VRIEGIATVRQFPGVDDIVTTDGKVIVTRRIAKLVGIRNSWVQACSFIQWFLRRAKLSTMFVSAKCGSFCCMATRRDVIY